MTNPPVRTAVALRFARLDRIAFQDAMAKDLYPAAPKTRPGAARMFDQYDQEALFIFARMLDQGVRPRIAGPLVGFIRERLPETENEDWIVVLRGSHNGTVVLGSKYDPKADYSGLGEVFFVEHIHLRAVREALARAAKYERGVHENAGLKWTPELGATDRSDD